MAGYRATQIRPPANETEFEKNCVVLFRELLCDPGTKRVGTRGQKQHGLDIVGLRDRDPNRLVGIQCKLKSGRSKLTKKETRDEIKKALRYKPPLSEYFIVTTSKDDAALLPIAQRAMQQQQSSGRLIHIEIWGWDTLQEQIDQYESAKNAFDPGWSPSVATQSTKLDTIIKGQKRQATAAQVEALTAAVEASAASRAERLPTHFADRELREALALILRRRGFASTDVAKELATLAQRAIEGELSLGSAPFRAEICDRAARASAAPETVASARRFRACAAALDPTRDLFITDALLLEAGGDADAALRKLKERQDPDTRSALFAALTRRRGRKTALNWADEEHLGPDDFNAPGAMNLVLTAIAEGEFDRARDAIAATPASSFNECPALWLLRAQLTLATILPEDRKAFLFQGLPLDPKFNSQAVPLLFKRFGARLLISRRFWGLLTPLGSGF